MTGVDRHHWVMRLADVSPATAFDVLSAVEDYPKFLPGFEAAVVLDRRDDVRLVENVLSLGVLKVRFRSRATLDPPKALTIVSDDGPWRKFRLRWSVGAEGDGCVVDCETDLDFKARTLAALARFAMPEVERQVRTAFAKRMREAQGRRSRPPDAGARNGA